MGVKLKKVKGVWWLFVNHKGKRSSKSLKTGDAKLAEQIRKRAEGMAALGQLGFLETKEEACKEQTFSQYSAAWLRGRKGEIKHRSWGSYEEQLRLRVVPRFGAQALTKITREEVKSFVGDLSNGKLARNTVRLTYGALRACLNAAVEDGIIASNPASRIGKFNKKQKGKAKGDSMTRSEAQRFLTAVGEICPGYSVFFLAALRAGLRKGELIALQWGHIQFGECVGPECFILVERTYDVKSKTFGSPKSGESRRVDMTEQLRTALVVARDERLLPAFMDGKTSISDDLVFPSETGGPIFPDNIAKRYLDPALEQAGIRRFRFHDLRHTYGSLLIQAGVSPAYVQKQMGHKSISVTIDIYGHLIPGANAEWVQVLDDEAPKETKEEGKKKSQSASKPHYGGDEGESKTNEKSVSCSKDLAAPQGFEPRYADPELESTSIESIASTTSISKIDQNKAESASNPHHQKSSDKTPPSKEEK